MFSRERLANAIRALSMDAIESARSGHPGAPLGMADIAEVVWNDFMRHNPANPNWFNRDRFVLSNGHASMLLYSLLHLSGYDLSLEEIKKFRQFKSKTPGHPEHGLTPGVETTTGPLGQGLANAVGMALAEKILAARFNRDGFNLVDHFTYVFAGDGCLMEGLSHECCSLAGTLGLGKLILLYDDNSITIDGPVEGWFSEDIPSRFEAYGWHVVRGVDGHNPDAIGNAVREARAQSSKPSIICCKTVIGFGAPNVCGKEKCHGSPLGREEIAAARKVLEWPYGPFEIPDDIYAGWDAKKKGARHEHLWNKMFCAYRERYPGLAEEFSRRVSGHVPGCFSRRAEEYIQELNEIAQDIATRKASQRVIEEYAPYLPELIGGSADLSCSNLTNWSGTRPVSRTSRDGNYIHYGVREFAMAAIMNGMALHGGFIPYGGTFLVFSDYARNAMRMSALMKLRTIYVLTHDSIGVGEDGPTHQPVEHTASLRLIPGMSLWRPADAVETAVAWKVALEDESGPTCLVLSRQTLPHLKREQAQLENIKRGAYVLRDPEGPPDALIIATGSEVAICLDAAEELARMGGYRVRVVSMPSVERFEAQDAGYRESVLPPEIAARVVVEAGRTSCWYKYAGSAGRVIGIDSFGESAPGKELFNHFGFTVRRVVEAVLEVLQPELRGKG